MRAAGCTGEVCSGMGPVGDVTVSGRREGERFVICSTPATVGRNKTFP